MAHYSGAPSSGMGSRDSEFGIWELGTGNWDSGWTRIDCFSALADLISAWRELCCSDKYSLELKTQLTYCNEFFAETGNDINVENITLIRDIITNRVVTNFNSLWLNLEELSHLYSFLIIVFFLIS